MSKGTMQTFMVVGRVGDDPEIKQKDESYIGKLSLATDGGRIKEGDHYKQLTTWLNVTVFGSNAKFCKDYIKKGSLISVKLTVKNNNWEDEEGKKHYNYDFIVDKLTALNRVDEESGSDPLSDVQ